MYIPIRQLLDSTAHRELVFGLYRALLRSVRQLAKLKVPENSEEWGKYSVDCTQYVRHLQEEARYAVAHEMRLLLPRNMHAGTVLRRRLDSGVRWLEAVGSQDWDEVVRQVLEYRSAVFEQQVFRLQYLEKEEEINLVRNRRKDQLTVKRMISRKARRDYFQRLKEPQETEDKSESNTRTVLRRHLSLLGLGASPANPYVRAVIKPLLEHDFNVVTAGDLAHSVNERGPYPVKINMNNSGPYLVPILTHPRPNRAKLQRIALDIKRLVRLVSLMNVWELDPDTTFTHHGSLHPDGSVLVKGSRGFGTNERVFPMYHHTELGVAEAEWELTLQRQAGGEVDQRTYDLHVDLWLEAVRETKSYLRGEYDMLKARNRVSLSLFETQKRLQHVHNARYDVFCRKLQRLTTLLAENNVFKHSDLVNPDRVTSPKPGLHLRVGMGKTIADYLEEAGWAHFRWGMFHDRNLRLNPPTALADMESDQGEVTTSRGELLVTSATIPRRGTERGTRMRLTRRTNGEESAESYVPPEEVSGRSSPPRKPIEEQNTEKKMPKRAKANSKRPAEKPTKEDDKQPSTERAERPSENASRSRQSKAKASAKTRTA